MYVCVCVCVCLFVCRLALGVVQGYDPDYDILLNSASDESRFTTVQLLVCVDTASTSAAAAGGKADTTSSSSCGQTFSSSAAKKEPSGWIDPDHMNLCQGTILHLSVIG
jgi:hypothetical protein